MAYARLAPFGAEADDYRSGLAMAVSANPHRGKSQRAFKPHDFMLGALSRVSERAEMESRMDELFATLRPADKAEAS